MFCRTITLAVAVTTVVYASVASAAVFDITIDGSDAIFLAGRTDLSIPPANQPWEDGNDATNDQALRRHGFPTPEEIRETLPPVIPVSATDIIRVLDPAVGGVSFFNGFGAPIFGPGGNGLSGSNLSPLGGISGYIGPQGPLVGVFLDGTIPSGSTPPPTLNFSAAGLGIEFTSISPDLSQIFYIGDGVTSGGDFQQFVAPLGATRLVLGIPDGFGFVGVPGAYDDNDGAYRVRVGVNRAPPIPLPAPFMLLATGLAALGGMARLRRR